MKNFLFLSFILVVTYCPAQIIQDDGKGVLYKFDGEGIYTDNATLQSSFYAGGHGLLIADVNLDSEEKAMVIQSTSPDQIEQGYNVSPLLWDLKVLDNSQVITLRESNLGINISGNRKVQIVAKASSKVRFRIELAKNGFSSATNKDFEVMEFYLDTAYRTITADYTGISTSFDFTKVNGLRFKVNVGQTNLMDNDQGFDGQIYIKEIRIGSTVESVPPQIRDSKVLEFKNDDRCIYHANYFQTGIMPQTIANNELQLTSDGAFQSQRGYDIHKFPLFFYEKEESPGRPISCTHYDTKLDLSKFPVVRFKAKADSPMRLRIELLDNTDFEGYKATNGEHQVQEFNLTTQYEFYTADYSQMMAGFDFSKVTGIGFKFNVGEANDVNTGYTGNVYIKEIHFGRATSVEMNIYNITFKSGEDSLMIPVEGIYTYSIPEGVNWLTATEVMESGTQYIKLKSTPNNSFSTRETEVLINSQEAKDFYNITQMGQVGYIEVLNSNNVLYADEFSLVVEVNANVSFNLENVLPAWISINTITEDKILFDLQENSTGEDRIALVKITGSGGASAEFEVKQLAEYKNIINSVYSPYKLLTVYPNPASNSIRFIGNIPLNAKIQISNLYGIIVSNLDFEEETNVEMLEKGMYIIKLESNEGSVIYNNKLIIE